MFKNSTHQQSDKKRISKRSALKWLKRNKDRIAARLKEPNFNRTRDFRQLILCLKSLDSPESAQQYNLEVKE